ncbi:hypothetical protein MJN47_28930, partial [Salmonella enterica subsp. enterica serovar Lubbock]|nr:hypothetical protein [Salmonella enterica subsp. enterica serovar Lubbock]
GDASVYAHGGAVTINNSGTMDSSVFGVYVTTGHTLNNLAGGSNKFSSPEEVENVAAHLLEFA